MAYETFNYDIKSKMPLWWSEDTFLAPINRYAQELIRDIVGGLLTNIGLGQPVQVWKTLPTEYSWTHTYTSYDDRLVKNGTPTSSYLSPGTPVQAIIENSKRNCHGVIQLSLTGDLHGLRQPLKELKIKNGNQEIIINNITTTTDIKIFTEDNSILIDGVNRTDLVTGSFNKIYAQAKNTDYSQLDVEDENKITYLEIESDTGVNFKLQVKLIHPIYVTEQNIRVHTVSAFPIEYIKLYGFFCHDFNNKQEWRFLWEKHYDIEDRIVFDHITKQFDCETFYVHVKLHGIGIPFVYGFPQEELPSNPAFQINNQLDKWGKILGLPRRYYKTYISDEEEPFTYPPYYKYNIEQDYWYEERLVNEYKYNDEAIDATYIKDTDLNNIALLKCIDPFVEDLYVYTETIKPSVDPKHETPEINPSGVDEFGMGQTWKNSRQIANSNVIGAEVELKPQTSEYFNDYLYQTKILQIDFTPEDMPELPKNIRITGLQLLLNGLTDIHSDSLVLDDRSQMIITTPYQKSNNEVVTKTESVPINIEQETWKKGQGVYHIGGDRNLFGLPEITREQLLYGLTFNIAFTNNNTFLKALIVLYGIKLKIYYEVVEDDYTIQPIYDTKEIIFNENKNKIQMKIQLKNTGETVVTDKNIFIVTPPELTITNSTFPTFKLDIGETFVIGESERDKIIIEPVSSDITGVYDIIVFCDHHAIKDQIIIRGGFT